MGRNQWVKRVTKSIGLNKPSMRGCKVGADILFDLTTYIVLAFWWFERRRYPTIKHRS